MRGRFSVIVFIGVMLVLLVALNAASYVRVEREAELELRPDRSTLNAGASGTRALYEYLEESGRRVMRWRESPAMLLKAEGTAAGARPVTFVVVGALRVEFEKEEVKSLMEWVEAGGRLVVIDRAPPDSLIAGDEWQVGTNDVELPDGDVRADDAESLTRDATPLSPAQPTLFTRDVERVAPSRFASRLYAVRNAHDESANEQTESTPQSSTDLPADIEPESVPPDENAGDEATGSNENTVIEATEDASPQWSAPVFHLSDERGALLVDYARGRGRIIVLSDPFIVANRGINRADNLQLALNIITMRAGEGDNGLIAFDEFHQGRGATRNGFAAYFEGTPVLAMCAQLFLIAAAIVWTRGRRFARPLPAPRVDRRSKLEFVASMAELQQRARAFDLAVENIYGRTRRALARYGGSDASAPRASVAAGVAARSGRSRDEIESLMRACEDAINGAPVTPRQSLALVASLRELERTLGIRMRAREIKQNGRL